MISESCVDTLLERNSELCSKNAENCAIMDKLCHMLKTKPEHVAERVTDLVANVERLRAQVAELQEKAS